MLADGELLPGCAGTGLFDLLLDCWTCNPDDECGVSGVEGLGFYYLALGLPGTPGNITTAVTMPGGGNYRLAYELQNKNSQGLPNSWRAIIETLTGPSFSPIIGNVIINAPYFLYKPLALAFQLPPGTTSISLTFEGRQVSPQNLAKCFSPS